MLVMIFGSPRSGTTWLGKIFDSHPCVHYLHEPEIALPSDLPQFPEIEERSLALARRELAAWISSRDLRTCGTRPVRRKAGESGLHHGLRTAQIYLGKALERLVPRLGLWGPVLDPFGNEPPVRVVKTVNMLGRAGLFMAADERMRAIHLLRHPCGQVASMLRGIRKFGVRSELTYDALIEAPMGKAEGLTLERLERMGPVERLAWKWVIFNDAAYAALADSDRAHIVRYEHITADPAAAVRDLFAALGIDLHADVEDFVRASSAGSGNGSHYSLRRDPQKAAARWRSELDDGDVALIEDVCRRSEAGRHALEHAA